MGASPRLLLTARIWCLSSLLILEIAAGASSSLRTLGRSLSNSLLTHSRILRENSPSRKRRGFSHRGVLMSTAMRWKNARFKEQGKWYAAPGWNERKAGIDKTRTPVPEARYVRKLKPGRKEDRIFECASLLSRLKESRFSLQKKLANIETEIARQEDRLRRLTGSGKS